MVRKALCFCTLLALVFAVGCGGSGGGKTTYPVSGTVKFADGSPLTAGEINFVSKDTTARGKIQSDGSFKLGTYKDGDGAPAGSYRISIVGARSEGTGQQDKSGQYDMGKPLVHPKYESPDGSKLTYEVKPDKGANANADFTVEKP